MAGGVRSELTLAMQESLVRIETGLARFNPMLTMQEFGRVATVGLGVATVHGLPGVQNEELVRFASGRYGIVFNLDPEQVGVVLLGDAKAIQAGDQVARTGRVMDVPVGEQLLGRVINAIGEPLDELGTLRTAASLPIERPAPPILQRAPVTVPLQTGWKAVDALLPIGRGQRELILGDRQTGKTTLAVDAIINQAPGDVLCIYCSIGRRNADVARVISDLRMHDALAYTVVLVATGDEAPGLQFVAPYAATSIGEHFMENGRDVLIIYDDLTHHARAYRELSLLMRRPPGREAFPGDIFYLHSRLLERATRLRPEFGGGSLTALPIVETQAQDLSAYIPTNLISITDGQIYLSPVHFRRGTLPAVDLGRSVSRVGGKAQLPAYRSVAGALGLAYAQFEELETFARFSTRLDEETHAALERGRRVRAMLQQEQHAPVPAAEQVAVLLAVTTGALDRVPVEAVPPLETALRAAVNRHAPQLLQGIAAGGELEPADRAQLERIIRETVDTFLSGFDRHEPN